MEFEDSSEGKQFYVKGGTRYSSSKSESKAARSKLEFWEVLYVPGDLIKAADWLIS